MSEDTTSTVTLNYILASVKTYLQEFTTTRDEYFMQLIIDCITDMNIFSFDVSGVKTVTLPISDIRTVDLPPDFIEYNKIAFLSGNQVIEMTFNPNLAIPTTEDCGELANELPEGATYHVCSTGGYTPCTYRIDKRNNRIILSNSIPANEVHLEYFASGIHGDCVVPRYVVPAVRSYVIWQSLEYDPKVPMSEKERKGFLYKTEMRRVSQFNAHLTYAEIIDSLRR